MARSGGAPDGRDHGPGGARAHKGGGQGRQGVRRPRKKGGAGRPDPSRGFIEGRRAVAEAIEVGVPIKRALVAAGSAPDKTLSQLVGRLEGQGVPVKAVPRARLDSLSAHGAHQGIVCETSPFPYVPLDGIVERAGEGDALVIMLDHVTDEGNLGAIVRSADALGAAGVVIARARAAGVGVGAYKTSAGAVLRVPIAQVSNLVDAVKRLKEAGFWVAAATEHAWQDVWEAPLDGRLCLVMGSEGQGISRLVRENADFECRLPQRGQIESLNVAQATTVIGYEWLRRQGLKEKDGA